MLDVLWITSALLLGLLARLVGLPPLVGYLVAGFGLHAVGVEADALILAVSELGITLLLFLIGLKLKLRSLAAPHVYAVALLHLAAMLALVTPLLLALGGLGVPYLDRLSPGAALLVAFALSFSSTVFTVKLLEDRGELAALYGTIAIGILIIQDLAAVVFLGFAEGHMPSPWSLLLLLLIPLRRWVFWLFSHAGHGELLLLFGLTIAIGGGQVFAAVHIEANLGALLLGVLLAPHPKASELSKELMGLKDVMLVGFFLGIGLRGAPTLAMDLLALLLVALVPLKALLFQRLLLGFRLRARTAFLSGATLANYSEFGLIVAAVGLERGWLGAEWLTIIALSLALSFVLAALLNTRSHELYERFSARLCAAQQPRRITAEAEIDPGDADAMVIGMGQVGRGAYDALREQRGHSPVGIDADPDRVARLVADGRHVVLGSATDADFWHRLHLDDGHLKLVLLALPRLSENVFAAVHLRREGYAGVIGAIAEFPDDEPELRAAGVDQVFNLYAEAGAGFAQHVTERAARADQARFLEMPGRIGPAPPRDGDELPQ